MTQNPPARRFGKCTAWTQTAAVSLWSPHSPNGATRDFWKARHRPARVQDPKAQAAVTPSGSPEWRQPEVVEQRHYRILGSRFRVCFSSTAQMQMVHPVLEHLEVPGSSDDATAVDIRETPDRLVVYRDREVFEACARITELAPIVKSLVWTTTVDGHEFFLDIHAGVIGDGARCILLPAPPGSGKSTLTAALVHAGYQYFSDEVALLEEGSFHVFPFRWRSASRRRASMHWLTGSRSCANCRPHERGDGKQVVYMPPPRERLPDNRRPVPGGGAGLSTVRAGRDDVVGEPLEGRCAQTADGRVRGGSGAPGFRKGRSAGQWVSRTPCLGLTYGSTESAISVVRSLFV